MTKRYLAVAFSLAIAVPLTAQTAVSKKAIEIQNLALSLVPPADYGITQRSELPTTYSSKRS